ncbi:MAG: response regulator [Polyangiaceae bacterium]
MSSLRLLVIDDSMTIRKLVELSLRGSAWTTEFAASGEEGISRAKQSPPDLILLDFVLPDMRGSDVCARLSKNPATARVPILVMSAKHENVRELFRDFPQVADFVPKPFNAAEIQSRLERLKPAAAAPDAVTDNKPSAARSLTFQQKEAAAQAIYARIHPLLSRNPRVDGGARFAVSGAVLCAQAADARADRRAG